MFLITKITPKQIKCQNKERPRFGDLEAFISKISVLFLLLYGVLILYGRFYLPFFF